MKNSLLLSGLVLSLLIFNCQTTINDPCPATPGSNSSGVKSVSTSLSHNAGRDCLSCHDGSAAKSFDVAGTVVSGLFSTDVALPGTAIRNVGGDTMTVDQCGNFYSVTNSATTTQPSTDHGSMKSSVSSGSCNKSGCHDGSTTPYMY